jgi:hypothetical protein
VKFQYVSKFNLLNYITFVILIRRLSVEKVLKIKKKNYFAVTVLSSQFKGTVQRDTNFVFLTYIDSTRSEYEPLLILNLFRGPHDFRSKKNFFTLFRRNLFGKIIFF